MSHIFISYSKQDKDFVRYLHALLEAQGFDVWFDDELNPGDDWWSRLERQIVGCGAFLVIMSTNSKGSKWVNRELLLAEKLKIPVFPVLISGDMWANLADVQYADMRKGLHATLPNKLLNSLKAIYSGEPRAKTLEFAIEFGSITDYPADVAVFKYAYGFHGADALAAEAMIAVGIPDGEMRAKQDDFALLDTKGALQTPKALFIGTRRLRQLGYGGIRELGAEALRILKIAAPETRQIVMTIHGPGFGLDESEAMLSQFAGYLDALDAGMYPPDLERITIIEFNQRRVERLQRTLENYLAGENYAQQLGNSMRDWRYALTIVQPQPGDPPQAQPTAPEEPAKTHAYVIMPDQAEQSQNLDDIFYYGIQIPVHARGLLCERLDAENIEVTDELMKQIMQRIDSAAVVIAEVSALDAQTAWQIGYAWGKKRPVILLTTTPDAVPFPGQTYLTYNKIRDLEIALTERLNALKTSGKM